MLTVLFFGFPALFVAPKNIIIEGDTPMKRKTILSLVIAIALLVSIALPLASSAAEMDEPSQIIINAPAGLAFDDTTDFFQAFKIFDVTFTGDNYSYVIVPAFEAFDDYPGADASYLLLDFLNDGPTATEMTDLAAALWAYIYYDGYDPNDIIRLVEPVGDVDVEESQVTIDLDVTGGGYGYYLVFHSASLFDDDEPFVQIIAACTLTTTNPVAEVTAKTDVPTLKKWLVLDDGTYAKVEGLSIGDIASFAIEVTLPTTFEGYDEENPYVLIVHDILGVCPEFFLGYDPEGVDGFVENITVSYWEQGEPTTITAFVIDDDYELTPGPYGFEIEFAFNALQAIPEGYSILIEYSAVVNEGIREVLKGTNSAWVEFSCDPYEDKTGATPPSVVGVYVSDLGGIVKVDGSTGEEGEGTWFERIDESSVFPTSTSYTPAFSPDMKYLAVPINGTPFVTIYNLKNGEPINIAGPDMPVNVGFNSAFSPDGHYLAVTLAYYPFIIIYDMTSVIPTKSTDPDIFPSSSQYGCFGNIAFSPNGQYLAMTHDAYPYLTIYDMTGNMPIKLDDPKTLPTDSARIVVFSPDNKYLVVTSAYGYDLMIYDMTGGEATTIQGFTTPQIYQGNGAAFSPDGKLLAIASTLDPYLTIYDMTGIIPIKLDTLDDLPDGLATGIAFSPDGQFLVVTSLSHSLTIYDMTNGFPNKMAAPDKPPHDMAMSLVYSPDGRFLAVRLQGGSGTTYYRTPTPATTTYTTHLTGAEFELYKLTTLDTPDANGDYYDIGDPIPFSEDSSGNLLFDGNPENEDDIFYTLMSNPEVAVTGIGPGLYMLRETVAPNGYNKLTYDIFFEITLEYDDDTEEWVYVKKVYFDTANTFLATENAPSFDTIFDSIHNIFETIYIENYSGTLFPGTGGIGTAIFYAISLLLTGALTAYAIATTRKRKTTPTV